MATATKEQILSTKSPVEEVPWTNGMVVNVAAMSSKDRDAFEIENVALAEAGANINPRARLLVRCLVDDSGNRLFEDSDADELGNVWGRPMDRAFDVAKRLNGYDEEDIKELEKNSVSAPSDSSGTI